MHTNRLRALSRFLHPSAWRFLALVATEPELQYLYTHQRLTWRDPLAEPAPWLTRDAQSLIEQLVHPRMRVIEWGAGASTLWLAERVAEVHSIEHDEHWYANLAPRLPDNVQLTLSELGPDYHNPPGPIEKADLIIIDGRQRNSCAATLLRHWVTLRSGCHILFDDAQRPRYRNSIRALRQMASSTSILSGSYGVPLDKYTELFVV